jgi:hypothetical protein
MVLAGNLAGPWSQRVANIDRFDLAPWREVDGSSMVTSSHYTRAAFKGFGRTNLYTCSLLDAWPLASKESMYGLVCSSHSKAYIMPIVFLAVKLGHRVGQRSRILVPAGNLAGPWSQRVANTARFDHIEAWEVRLTLFVFLSVLRCIFSILFTWIVARTTPHVKAGSHYGRRSRGHQFPPIKL